MAKRPILIRLDEKLLKSLNRFVDTWNRSGAPSTNRTLLITTAINKYLKDWGPSIRKPAAVGSRGAQRTPGRVLGFPHSPGERPTKAQGILTKPVWR